MAFNTPNQVYVDACSAAVFSFDPSIRMTIGTSLSPSGHTWGECVESNNA